MREENFTIVIIGTGNELKTIKQFLEEHAEEYGEEYCITIEEQKIPEMHEICLKSEENLTSELQKRLCMATEKPSLLSLQEYYEISENSETLKDNNKEYEKPRKVKVKPYKEPCISTRHYWRGNIK